MTWSKLFDLSALEQADGLRERAFSSEELTRLYLERIRLINPKLHAFVEIMDRSALRDARRKDQEIAQGAKLPPFHGVPIGIKDLNFVRGAGVRFGSRAASLRWSPIDDRTTARLRRAGFVILGKLATSEFGAMPITEPDIHPPTANPWDLSRTAGGSSGGSGAAVAAALLPIAHASDGAGSIRIPSALCHLFGFKPSRGIIPNAFGFDYKRLLYTDGPIARTVDDAAAWVDIMTRRGESSGSLVEAARKPPPSVRIRVATRTPLAVTDPEVERVVENVSKELTKLGHQVEEASMPEAEVEDFLPIWQFQVAQFPLARWSRAQPVTRWLREAGRRYSRDEVAACHDRLDARVREWFGQVDLWLTPTTPSVAPPTGLAHGNLTPEEAFRRAAVLGVFTAAANISGLPAASLPLGFSTSGLPIGVQLIGRQNGDALILSASRQLERALPWRHQWPPMVQEERATAIVSLA